MSASGLLILFHYAKLLFLVAFSDVVVVDWTERLAQVEFLLREEECKRIDAEEKYAILEQEILSQATEMEEKLAEMERTYHYRLMEQVITSIP